jgi:hypothetical protein
LTKHQKKKIGEILKMPIRKHKFLKNSDGNPMQFQCSTKEAITGRATKVAFTTDATKKALTTVDKEDLEEW